MYSTKHQAVQSLKLSGEKCKTWYTPYMVWYGMVKFSMVRVLVCLGKAGHDMVYTSHGMVKYSLYGMYGTV